MTAPERPTPNPGPEFAFELGLPYLTLDHRGRTHVSRNPVELFVATGSES